jgi:hypothetical protein
MLYKLNEWVLESQIDAAVKKAELALAPDVVHVRYSFDNDWTGDPSIFFKIVLADDASKESKLGEITRRVINTVRNEVMPEELSLNSYFNFRSLSEYNELNDPAWA